MALGDIYSVVTRQLLEGQELFNRFYYEALDSNDSAGRLASAFQDMIFPVWKSAICNDVTFVDLVVTNTYSPGYQVRVADGGTGGVAGAVLPRFTNAVFTLLPSNNLVRAGRKAIAGISEADIDGTFLQAASKAGLQVLADTMSYIITHTTSTAQFEPVLYSPPNLTHPASTIITPFSAFVKDEVSTQNSRKD